MSSTGLSSVPSAPSPTVYISEQPSSSRSCRLMGSTSSRRLGLLIILRLQHATARAVKEIDHGRPGSRLEPSDRSRIWEPRDRSARNSRDTLWRRFWHETTGHGDVAVARRTLGGSFLLQP